MIWIKYYKGLDGKIAKVEHIDVKPDGTKTVTDLTATYKGTETVKETEDKLKADGMKLKEVK